jgi:hypothetical protein
MTSGSINIRNSKFDRFQTPAGFYTQSCVNQWPFRTKRSSNEKERQEHDVYQESMYQVFGNAITIFNHIGDIIINNNQFSNINGVSGSAIKILMRFDSIFTKFSGSIVIPQ